MDQAKESMKELAGTVWAFYSELCAQGFSSEQALMLTIAWMQTLLGGASQ